MTLLIHIVVPVFRLKKKKNTFQIYTVIFECAAGTPILIQVSPNTPVTVTHLHLNTDGMLYPLICSHSVPLFSL